MNHYLNKCIEKVIIRNKLSSILIAISGGQDSLCLIQLIDNFMQNYNVLQSIEYIYIDHQWKKDSEKQIEHLINYISNTGKNLCIYQLNSILLSEGKAREHRYHIIINHAVKYKYQAIITAHTKTDRIETFFQNLIKGTSIDGATSLTISRKLSNKLYLMRPLIDIDRVDISWFCRKYCLPIWSDLTNYYLYIKRNRIRYELIPYLNNYFNNKVNDNLTHFLDRSNQENEYLKQNTLKLYISSRHSKYIALNYTVVITQHYALQSRILQLFFYHNFNLLITNTMIIQLIKAFCKKNTNIKILQWRNLKIYLNNLWIYIR
uniref:tRNA(Ile)-lysidine synthase n=1 Tax=Plumaria plumosa TaxID=189642 RepID=A0A4D6WWF3_9FLOR|nr:tRNA Ile-lysidine synthetase [Plumaria plumosa]